jgi:hypothetical protein
MPRLRLERNGQQSSNHHRGKGTYLRQAAPPNSDAITSSYGFEDRLIARAPPGPSALATLT